MSALSQRPAGAPKASAAASAAPFAPLGAALNRLIVGEPIPFDIYDKQQVLLLASGNVIESARQLRVLIERGGLVLLEEVTDPRQAALHAPRSHLPEVWNKTRDLVTTVLTSTDEPQFEDRLQSALPVMQTLVERDPDLAIFQVISRSAAERASEGVRQATATAAIAIMLGNRLGWTGEMVDLAAKCALTMNLSILELMGRSTGALSLSDPAVQRELKDHPLRSRKILENAGINDTDWLRAVEEHHERPDGSGYPRGIRDVNETSLLVQCVDTFVDGLASPKGGVSMTATGLLRQMYLADPKAVFVTTLIKELGVYPPGSIVRLDNDEIGMVMQRGLTGTTPVVAVLAEDLSLPAAPVLRDTADETYRVIGVVSAHNRPS